MGCEQAPRNAPGPAVIAASEGGGQIGCEPERIKSAGAVAAVPEPTGAGAGLVASEPTGAGAGLVASEPTGAGGEAVAPGSGGAVAVGRDRAGSARAGQDHAPHRNDSVAVGRDRAGSARAVDAAVAPVDVAHVAVGRDRAGSARVREWAVLGEWLAAPLLLHEVDLGVLQERLGFMGRARAALAALEADVVAEISRRDGDAAAEETLRRTQKRSRSGARKAVKVAAQLEWAPSVAEKLADGAITPEAAGLILDAAGEAPIDHGVLLDAAESEPDDLFRRTLKEHVNERTSEEELEARRARQRRRRRASISEQADGMFHLFAQLDPLVGNRVRNALLAKADGLFRSEDTRDRPTPPQRLADALAQLVCNSDPAGAPAGTELIVLADYDQVRDEITNARLADGTRLTEAEALAVACDARILPGIFNKHTANAVLGRSQRKIPPWLRKQLIARDGACIGCGAHHNICQVHHIRHWAHGGETTLDNTCLLCWRCHQVRVHRHGEEVTRRPDGRLTLGPPTDASDPPADASETDPPTRPPPHDHHRHDHHRPHRHRPATPSRPEPHPSKPVDPRQPVDPCRQLSLTTTTPG